MCCYAFLRSYSFVLPILLLLGGVAAGETEIPAGRFGGAFAQDRHGLSLFEARALPVYQQPPLTVELWVKLPRADTFNVFLANGVKESPAHWELYAFRGDGDFSVFLPGAQPDNIRSGVSVSDGAWHFLAFTYAPDRVRLYVDGEMVADQAITLKPDTAPETQEGFLTFGRVVSSKGRIPFMQGLIDDVRISKTIRKDFTPPDAPLEADEHTAGLWSFDTRNADGGFTDAAPSGNDILARTKPKRSLNMIDLLRYAPGPGPLAAPAEETALKAGPIDHAADHTVLDLSGAWELAEAGDPVARIRRDWQDGIAAEVPGSVHGALWKAGRIPNPYFGKQDATARQQSFKTWWYRKTFRKTEGLERVRLVFDGVAIHCKVWLNNEELGEHEGMFGGPVFDISGILQEENTLVVRIGPAPVSGPAEEDINKMNYGWNGTVVFNNVYGWHYCNIPSLGIWRGVRVEAVPAVEIRNPFIATRDAQKGDIDLSVPLRGPLEGWTGILRATVEPDNFDGATHHFEWPVEAESAMAEARLRFTIPGARVWWPNDLGDQPLYRLCLSFAPENSGQGDTTSTLFGVRTVEQAPLPGGPYPNKCNWQFIINGERIFVKGTGWCTMDPLMDFSYARYERLLQLAQSQHIQMFRAWGSGMPETDEFYEACDRYGVMVLQEWPTAWNSHERQPFDVLEETVRLNTLRIRNHPALVMYGGGNESSHPYGAAIDMMGRYAVELDGTRAFHRGEPYGGSIHNYDCYWGRQPLDRNLRLTADFIGEFGLASMPVLESVLRYTPEEEQAVWPPPADGTIAHHTPIFNTNEDMARLKQYSAYFMPQDSLENFITGSQLAQATGVRHTLERARTRYPEATGALYYKMNDNYPAASWACADWYGAPKIGHYVFQDAFAPLHACVIFQTLNPRGKAIAQPVFLLDDADALADRSWEAAVRAYDRDLREIARKTFSGSGGIDKVHELGVFELTAEETVSTPILTVAEVHAGGEKKDRTFYWSNYEAEAGSLMKLPRAAVSMAIENNQAVLTNTGNVPAVGVHISRPGHAHTFMASDNYIWLDPGENHAITVSDTEGLTLNGWNLAEK
jgi:beta-mannosidase